MPIRSLTRPSWIVVGFLTAFCAISGAAVSVSGFPGGYDARLVVAWSALVLVLAILPFLLRRGVTHVLGASPERTNEVLIRISRGDWVDPSESVNRPWAGEKALASGQAASRKSGGGGLDFVSARATHLSWKSRLRRFLDGKEEMSMEQAVSPRHCELGQWLYGGGLDAHGHRPEMLTLEKLHAEMHGYVGDVIRHRQAGDQEQAERSLDLVAENSDRVVRILSDLEQQIKFRTIEPQAVPSRRTSVAARAVGDTWEAF